MTISDMKNIMHCVLVVIDVAANFKVARYICADCHPNAAATKLFEEAGLSWARPPVSGIVSDLDTVYPCEFRELVVAGVTLAFLQGLPSQREIYFRLPHSATYPASLRIPSSSPTRASTSPMTLPMHGTYPFVPLCWRTDGRPSSSSPPTSSYTMPQITSSPS